MGWPGDNVVCCGRIWAGVQLAAHRASLMAASALHDSTLTMIGRCYKGARTCSRDHHSQLNTAAVAGSGRECSFELTERLSWLPRPGLGSHTLVVHFESRARSSPSRSTSECSILWAGSGQECRFKLTKRLSWPQICQGLASGAHLVRRSCKDSQDVDMSCCAQGLGESAALS